MKFLLPLLAFATIVASGCSKETTVAGKKADTAYTLGTCVISGNKLGEMGAPFVTNYNGKEVQLCCKNCVKDFDKDPAMYLKKIADAEAAAKK